MARKPHLHLPGGLYHVMLRGSLADIREKTRAAKITRAALILVGPVLGQSGFSDSRLYDPEHRHILRPKRRA